MSTPRISPWTLIMAVAVPALLLPAQGCDPSIPADWNVSGITECRDLENATEGYYDVVMKPFFDEYCSYCHASSNEDRHGAPGAKNFDTFDAAKVAPGLTWARVANFEMPPLGRLPSTGELDTLLDWLNCVSEPALGLPEEIGECPDDSTVTSADVEVVLDAKCDHCHSADLEGAERNDAPDGVDWDSASDLTGYGDDSYIWERIHSGEMPKDGPMTPDEALVIWEWFSCGSP